VWKEKERKTKGGINKREQDGKKGKLNECKKEDRSKRIEQK
jgi:hypothetical protein